VQKKDGECFQDGLVIEHALDGGIRDGKEVRAGSMKVWYDQGNKLKWVAPSSKTDKLIPNPPQECSALRPWGAFGTLRALKGNAFFPVLRHCDMDLINQTDTVTAYVELHGGYLQWWNDIESARVGKPSDGNVELSKETACWWSDQKARNALIVAKRKDPDPNGLTFFIIPKGEGLNWIWKTALMAQTKGHYTEQARHLPGRVVGSFFL